MVVGEKCCGFFHQIVVLQFTRRTQFHEKSEVCNGILGFRNIWLSSPTIVACRDVIGVGNGNGVVTRGFLISNNQNKEIESFSISIITTANNQTQKC